MLQLDCLKDNNSFPIDCKAFGIKTKVLVGSTMTVLCCSPEGHWKDIKGFRHITTLHHVLQKKCLVLLLPTETEEVAALGDRFWLMSLFIWIVSCWKLWFSRQPWGQPRWVADIWLVAMFPISIFFIYNGCVCLSGGIRQESRKRGSLHHWLLFWGMARTEKNAVESSLQKRECFLNAPQHLSLFLLWISAGQLQTGWHVRGRLYNTPCKLALQPHHIQ